VRERRLLELWQIRNACLADGRDPIVVRLLAALRHAAWTDRDVCGPDCFECDEIAELLKETQL
jgi:hypothetical protein